MRLASGSGADGLLPGLCGRDRVIAVRGRERSVGRSSFAAAIRYALREGESVGPVYAFSDGVISMATAAVEMAAVAQRHPELEEPVYHLIVSWSPGERPSFEQAQTTARRTLARIGFQHPQYVAALHNDGVGGCYHLHVITNRRDAVTGRAVNTYDDYERMMGAMRELEVEQGWRRVQHGERMRVGTDRYNAHRRFVEFVRRDVRDAVARVVAAEGATWTELHGALRELGCRYEVVQERVQRKVQAAAESVKTRTEARIVAVASGVAALVREAGTTHEALCRKLGDFIERGRTALCERGDVMQRARRIASELRETDVSLRSWSALHRACAEAGLVLECSGVKDRVLIADVSSGATVLGGACGLSRVVLERLIGSPFESSEESEKKEAQRRRHEQREDRALARRLIANPTPIIETLTERQAIFRVRDLDADLSTRFRDEGVMARVRDAVVKACVAVRAPLEKRAADEWGLRLTNRAILDEESALQSAARALAQRRSLVNQPDLRLIVGASPQRRDEIVNAEAAQAREYGASARIVVVSDAGARALRESSGLPVSSVATEIARLKAGAAQLRAGDVVVLSGAQVLGSEDGATLLAAVNEAGARLVAFSAAARGASVARGDVARVISEACAGVDGAMLDLTPKVPQWQQEVIDDLRSGRIAQGIATLRERGHLQGALSRESARGLVVARWRDDVLRGVDARIVVGEDEERKRLNSAAREVWRAAGALTGAEYACEVMDGRLAFAAGDRVVFRQTVPGTSIRAGSEAEIVALRGSVWTVAVKGEHCNVCVDQYSGVQHAYATAERREGEAELRLLTPGVTAFTLVHPASSAFALYYDAESFRDGLVAAISEATLRQEKVLAQECALLARSAQTMVRQSDEGALVAVGVESPAGGIESPDFAEQSEPEL